MKKWFETKSYCFIGSSLVWITTVKCMSNIINFKAKYCSRRHFQQHEIVKCWACLDWSSGFSAFFRKCGTCGLWKSQCTQVQDIYSVHTQLCSCNYPCNFKVQCVYDFYIQRFQCIPVSCNVLTTCMVYRNMFNMFGCIILTCKVPIMIAAAK